MDLTTSYKILGLVQQADEQAAKRAYKVQVRRWHPDQFPDGSSVKAAAEEQLKQINIAYARVKAHLALHRREPIDPAAATGAHQSAGHPPRGETASRKRRQRSWMDHLFDALNAFADQRTAASQTASVDRSQTKPRRPFEAVLSEMTGGMPPPKQRSAAASGPSLRRHDDAVYRQYRRRGSRVSSVGPTEGKGPVEPVSRIRGIGRKR